MIPTTPQEISDMIVDFLHNDIAALCSAGLVCKSWLPASRFHLFPNIDLSALINVHHGLEVICAEGSTIPPYILHLEIVDDESQSVDETLLRLPLLTNLKSLYLTQIRMENLTEDAKMRLNSMSRNLTSLSFSDFRFETVNQAVDLIASASHLENIDFNIVGCDEICNYSSQAVAPPLRLIRFETDPLLDNIMDWFCRCHPKPSVHTLAINRVTAADNIPKISDFIRYLGSALEDLAISCSDFYQIEIVQFTLSERIDLSQNISLRNIFFNDVFLYADLPRKPSCGWIISIVSRIAHRSLESVTISIFLDHVEEISALDLSALDTLFLTQPLSENSPKLCFCIRGSVDKSAALATLKDGLPGLDGKERLEFDLSCHHTNDLIMPTIRSIFP